MTLVERIAKGVTWFIVLLVAMWLVARVDHLAATFGGAVLGTFSLFGLWRCVYLGAGQEGDPK